MFGKSYIRPAGIAGLSTAIFGLALWLAGNIAAAENANPDGKLGRPIITIAGDYASATGEPGFYVQDFQNAYGSLSLPISTKATGSIIGQWHRQDSVRYFMGLAARLYLFSSDKDLPSNPDGQLRRPLLDIQGGLRRSSNRSHEPKIVTTTTIIYPHSERLTFQAGFCYYQSIQVQDIESFSAGLTYYAGPAVVDSFLVNPDGPIGYPIFTLRGGGSKYGLFSELTISSPINRQISFYFRACAEKVKSPYSHNLIAGFGLTWFAP